MEEISLSLAETNKLRASIGLPLIPEPEKIENRNPVKVKGSGESLSVEETNKLRASLGLKPIPVETGNASVGVDTGSNSKSGDSAHTGERFNREKGSKVKSALKNAESAKKDHGKVRKTLLDDYEAQDTDDWLSQLSSKPKESKKISETVDPGNDEEKASEANQDTVYMDALSDGDVLTLQDQDILEDINSDVLYNDQKEQQKKADEKMKGEEESKNQLDRRNMYRGFEDTDESVTLRNDSSQVGVENNTEFTKPKSDQKVALENLFGDDRFEFGDTGVSIKKGPVKMKKLKKKSKAANKARVNDDEDIPQLKEFILETEGADQGKDELEELESVLSLTRRNKNKRSRSNATPEQIASEMKRARIEGYQDELDSNAFSAGANTHAEIIYSGTADFLDSLTTQPTAKPHDRVASDNNETTAETAAAGLDPVQEKQIDNESPNIDTTLESTYREEPTLGRGLASTLKYLEARNEISRSTPREKEQERLQREALKKAELFKMQLSVEERLLREELHSDKHYMSLPKKERENIFADKLERRLEAKGIATKSSLRSAPTPRESDIGDYKPDVKIAYRDESGNELNTKQAFKFMSRKFHGYKPKPANKNTPTKPSGKVKKREHV